MWKRFIGPCVAVLASAAFPVAVYAQDPGANDPSGDSPSGAVYKIPLDNAREDAAPEPPSGAVSPIRSDNGLSSSSEVPGAPADVSADEGSGSQSNDTGRGQSRDRSPARGEAGRRSGDDGSSAERLIRATNQASAGPSHTRSYLLLALGVLVAVALGVTARRAARGR